MLSLVLSLALSSTAYAQTTQSNSTDAEPKKVPSVKELSDGIFAFICDEIDNAKNVPLIFIDQGGKWHGKTVLIAHQIELPKEKRYF